MNWILSISKVDGEDPDSKISPKLYLHKLEPDSIPTLPNIACFSLALSHTI